MSHGAMYLLPRTARQRASRGSEPRSRVPAAEDSAAAGRGSEPRSHVPFAEDSAAAGGQGK